MAVITAAAVTAAGTAYAANKSSKAAKAQINANKDAQDITRQAAREAKGEAVELFDRGLQRQAQGFGQSIDLLAGGMQPQADMMNQGNLNAQNTLLGGGQGFMSAILGSGGDPYANLQAQQVTPDFSYLANFVQQQNQMQQPQQQEQTPNPNITPFQSFNMMAGQGQLPQYGRGQGANLFSGILNNPNYRFNTNNNGRLF